METVMKDESPTTRMDVPVPPAGRSAAGEPGRERESDLATEFTADVQDLLTRIAHVADPEIARLRIRVKNGLSGSKRAFADGSERMRSRARDGVRRGDAYVHEQPWRVVGVAAIAGLAAGFVLGRRR